MNTLDLSWLLSPLNLKSFRNKIMESETHYFTRADNYYNTLITEKDIDRILTASNHRPFSMVKDGLVIAPNTHDNGTNKGKVVELFNHGATIILDNLEQSWGPLKRLCNNVRDEFPLYCKEVFANMYLTPPNAQGFKIHSDWQDVFILQISGSKLWSVYSPQFKLPINANNTKITNQKKLKLLLKQQLTQGDLLYVPRGFPHDVKTTDELSMHITFSIIPFTWHDITARLLETVSNSNVDFRRTLNENILNHPRDIIESELSNLLNSFYNKELILNSLEQLKREITNKKKIDWEGFFSKNKKVETITIDSMISSVSYLSKLIQNQENGSIIIRTSNGALQLQEGDSAIRYIIEHKRFKIDSIPGQLSDADKLELIKILLKEGLVNVDNSNS